MIYKIKFTNKKDLENLRFVLDAVSPLAGKLHTKIINKNLKLIDKVLNKKPISISSRKAKGRNLQQWVCKRIAAIYDIIFDNQDDQCVIHSREMGQSGTDVILRGKIYNKFKFDIECKNTESLNLYKTIDQAKNNTEINRDWLIVHKKNDSKPIIIMGWEAFENLIKDGIYE